MSAILEIPEVRQRVSPLSVEEYGMVLGAERRVEVYRRPEQGRYQEKRVFGPEDPLDCAAVPGVRFRVDRC